jgi:predicted transcriptional regulator
VRELRSRGLTVADIAQALDASPAAVARILHEPEDTPGC